MEYFIKFCTALHCLDTGIQNKDTASPSISVADHGQLVKIHITLETHGLF